jgi:hypothetical protein
MKVTKPPSLLKRILFCGALLLIVSGYLFFNHSSLLDEHTHHMHAKPMFTQSSSHNTVSSLHFSPKQPSKTGIESTIPMPAVLPTIPSVDPIHNQKLSSSSSVSNKNSSLVSRAALQGKTGKKDLSFVVNAKCRSMLNSMSGKIQQWGKARQEIGLQVTVSNNHRSVITAFYGITYGCLTISNNGEPMTFVMIWKCANDAIRKNMMAYEKRNGPVLNPHKARPALLNKGESHSSVEYKKKMEGQFGLKHYSKAFAFTREPISHFISGLAEYYWRNYQKSVITTEQLKLKLDGMLQFSQLNEKRDSVSDRSQRYVLWHFYAMSGVLKPEYNIGYLGKLESFTEDWGIINSIYKTEIQINTSLGWHESSDDPNGVKAAFKELFKRDVRYKRALCQLLYVDYVCFNYDLPPECSDVAVTSKADTENTVVKKVPEKSRTFDDD